MDIINPSITSFHSKYIIPEVNDELTTQWGRAIVNNLANGYGIVGNGKMPFQTTLIFPIPIYRIFKLPPAVMVMWKYSTDTIWRTQYEGQHRNMTIWISYTDTSVSFRANQQVLYGQDTIDIVFKIHGV